MSLTETAHVSRKLIKFGGSGLVIFLFLWTAGVAGIKAWRAAHPPYVPPTTRYGVLPRVVFPEKSFEKKEMVMELPNDSLPKFGDQAKVYIVYRPLSRFLALEQETKTAANLRFVDKPIPRDQNNGIYEFRNNQLNQTLMINVLDGSFKMTYPYLVDQMILTTGLVPAREKAITEAEAYLSQAGRLGKDLEEGEKKVSFWKIDNGELRPADGQVDAHITRVDFFRKYLENEVKILSSNFGQASVSVLLTGSTVDGKKVAEVSYKYTNIDRESFETYPIKTAEVAWNDLEMGNYWPAVDNTSRKVVIRKMYLAYFEPVTLTNYMQPIFVFEGDNNFVAYVPAVTDEWVK